MRVLHVGKYFPPYVGGMETYLRDIMVSLAHRGVANTALVHQSNTGFTSTTQTHETGTVALTITRAAVWLRLLFTPISPTLPFLLSRMIREQQPDVLHLHMPNASVFWALLIPRARALPWVVQWQSDVMASEYSWGLRLFYRLYRPFETAVLRRSAVIIASSPPYLESSEPLSRFRAKCQVIPLGLDPTQLAAPSGAPHGQPRERPLRVLAIGRLTYYKGFDHLIKAVATLPGVELHLVGTGDLDDSLKELAHSLKARDAITFHGHLSDEALAQQFAQCDCLCLPSVERTEAFGLVLLEAMYAGRATLISDVPGSGMGWVVDDGVTGITVPPADAAALAEALKQLRDNRPLVERLGRQGREKFDHQFHIDQTSEALLALYRQLLQLPQPREPSG